MKTPLTGQTIREVSTQCTFAIAAYENINIKASNTLLVFSSIHSFLSHCRNIWLLLVNPKLSEDIQPKTIREILNVSTSSPLANTQLRNMLEHYDERLYEWTKTLQAGSLVSDFTVGPINAIRMPTGSAWIRHYDPVEDEFSILGVALKLGPMLQEARRIKVSADSWLQSP